MTPSRFDDHTVSVIGTEGSALPPAASGGLAPDSFAGLICTRFGLPAAQFDEVVLRHALYRQALPLVWLLRRLDQDYFTPDRELVQAAAQLRTKGDLRDFSLDVKAFVHHPTNSRHRFLRGLLRLRVSAHRLQSLIKATLPEAQRYRDDDATPWTSRGLAGRQAH